MAAFGRCEVLFSLVFLTFILSRVPEICGHSLKSLYVPHSKENTNIHIFERNEAQNSVPDSTGGWTSDAVTGHSVYKRSATVESSITTNVFHLNDSHPQLMVHWAGEGSDVILCLARDSPKFSSSISQPSSVYISYNYGTTFKNKTELFKLEGKGYASLEKFFIHPKYNSHCVFTDPQNKVIFVTKNFGGNITRFNLNFFPSEVSFHEDEPLTFLVHDKVSTSKRLWITRDYGQTFSLVQEYVKSFYWSSSDSDGQPRLLYVERVEPFGTSSILASATMFEGRNYTVLIRGVDDFEVREDFMFATRRTSVNNSDLYISYKRGKFMKAHFPSELDHQAYHVADVSDGEVMVVVNHTEMRTNLYISQLKDSTGIHFSLSLEQIFCYFPNSTWMGTWLRDVVDESFADLTKVQGLRGIYIASKITLSPGLFRVGPEHVTSLITFDRGGEWKRLEPPPFDDDGQPIVCMKDSNCSLHLSQRFAQLFPVTRSVPILTSKAAPGIIIAMGTVGTSLKGHPGVFLSRDAGLTWRQFTDASGSSEGRGLKGCCFLAHILGLFPLVLLLSSDSTLSSWCSSSDIAV